MGTSLTVSSGNLNLSSGEAISLTTLTMTGGALSGSDNVTISGATSWTGGIMRGTGVTTTNGSLALHANNSTELDGRTLNMNGGAKLTGTSNFRGTPEMHGRSWKPLLVGKADVTWRDSFFYCYFFERGYATPTTTAVRTQTAKLIKYPGHDDWTEVFDLKADPYETKNLAADPAHADLRKSLEAEYEKQSKAIGFRIPEFADMPPDDGSLPDPGKSKKKKGEGAKKNKSKR